MRIPITDKFLLDFYKIIEKSGDAVNFFFPGVLTFKKAISPEYRKFINGYRKRKMAKNFHQFIYHLKKQGYIKSYNLKNCEGVLITKKGLKRVLKAKFKSIEKKKRKDGKWQMIIFDIPEKKRGLRDFLRENLILLGYRILQESVWVSPYDVLKETEVFIQENNIDKYVKIFLIEEIDI